MNLVSRLDHSFYTLTTSGRALFKPGLQVNNAIELLQFKRPGIGKDFHQFTSAELVLHLASCGWKDEELKKTKKANPYNLNSQKVWYKSAGTKISKLYLHALAVFAQRVREGIVSELWHFQPQAYYRAIIDGLPGILPNQPLSFYKMIEQRAQQQDSGREEHQDTDTNKEKPFEFDETGR